jgi:hypothetical protein
MLAPIRGSMVDTGIFRVVRDPWVGRLAQPFAVEDFRITWIKILDYSTESIAPRGQQALHSPVGQIC